MLQHMCDPSAKMPVPACSRCTGYRPILDAFRVFAKAEPHAYTEEAIAAASGAAMAQQAQHDAPANDGANGHGGNSLAATGHGHISPFTGGHAAGSSASDGHTGSNGNMGSDGNTGCNGHTSSNGHADCCTTAAGNGTSSSSGAGSNAQHQGLYDASNGMAINGHGNKAAGSGGTNGKVGRWRELLARGLQPLHLASWLCYTSTSVCNIMQLCRRYHIFLMANHGCHAAPCMQ